MHVIKLFEIFLTHHASENDKVSHIVGIYSVKLSSCAVIGT